MRYFFITAKLLLNTSKIWSHVIILNENSVSGEEVMQEFQFILEIWESYIPNKLLDYASSWSWIRFPR